MNSESKNHTSVQHPNVLIEFKKNIEKPKKKKLTATKLEISIGNIERGNLNILKSDRETNAVVASKTLFSSTITKVANVTKETYFIFFHKEKPEPKEKKNIEKNEKFLKKKKIKIKKLNLKFINPPIVEGSSSSHLQYFFAVIT